jgi:hypothetical protein
VDLGDTLGFRSDVYDKPAEQGGVLTNATTAVLTITLPDGTTATPSVTNPPSVTGKYGVDYVTSTSGPSGRYVGAWVFTMASGKTTSYVETFDVGASLITVDEAVAHLRAAGVVTTADDLDQLQWLCFVASDAVERDLGRAIMRRTVTEVRDGGKDRLNLWQTPVISITSVTESGTLLTASDYVINTTTGILYRGSTTSGFTWAWGRQNVTVVYVAGYLDPPRIVRKVALNGVQRMWQESQQAGHPLLEEVSAEGAIFAAAGSLTPLEMGAYNSLRSPGIA